MTPLVVSDLDGPILDCRERLHSCYRRILENAGYRPLDRGEYWSLRIAGVTRRQILERSGAAAFEPTFAAAWLDQIESPELLAMDHVQPDAGQFLQLVSARGVSVVIATLRQNAQLARQQVEQLRLAPMVLDVLTCPHAEGGSGKAARVATFARQHQLSPCLWIGDTEVDADAALDAGVPCVLVASGVRSRQFLERLAAELVVDSIGEVPARYIGGR